MPVFLFGAHGWVTRICQPWEQSPSRSWLLIVEAPGCLEHPLPPLCKGFVNGLLEVDSCNGFFFGWQHILNVSSGTTLSRLCVFLLLDMDIFNIYFAGTHVASGGLPKILVLSAYCITFGSMK